MMRRLEDFALAETQPWFLFDEDMAGLEMIADPWADVDRGWETFDRDQGQRRDVIHAASIAEVNLAAQRDAAIERAWASYMNPLPNPRPDGRCRFCARPIPLLIPGQPCPFCGSGHNPTLWQA